jgi:hypothetical protein
MVISVFLMMSWIVISRLIQATLSILWTVPAGLMILVLFVPDTAQWIVREILPTCLETVMTWVGLAVNHTEATVGGNISNCHHIRF